MSDILQNLNLASNDFLTFCEQMNPNPNDTDFSLFLSKFETFQKELKALKEQVRLLPDSLKAEKIPFLHQWVKEHQSFYSKMERIYNHFSDASFIPDPSLYPTISSLVKFICNYENLKNNFVTRLKNSDFTYDSFPDNLYETLVKVQKNLNLMYQKVFSVSSLLEDETALPREKNALETEEDYMAYLRDFYEVPKKVIKEEVKEVVEKPQEEEYLDDVETWVDCYQKFITHNEYYQQLDLSHPSFQFFHSVIEHPTADSVLFLKFCALEAEIQFLAKDKKSLLAEVKKERDLLSKNLIQTFSESSTLDSFHKKVMDQEVLYQIIFIAHMFQFFYILENSKNLTKENYRDLVGLINKYKKALRLDKNMNVQETVQEASLESEKPVTPGTSEESVTPGTSEEPVIPETSGEPVIPETSGEPVTPGTSEEPVTPGTSEELVIPETSEEPVIPETSEEPVIPETSEEPVIPETSEEPVTLGTSSLSNERIANQENFVKNTPLASDLFFPQQEVEPQKVLDGSSLLEPKVFLQNVKNILTNVASSVPLVESSYKDGKKVSNEFEEHIESHGKEGLTTLNQNQPIESINKDATSKAVQLLENINQKELGPSVSLEDYKIPHIGEKCQLRLDGKIYENRLLSGVGFVPYNTIDDIFVCELGFIHPETKDIVVSSSDEESEQYLLEGYQCYSVGFLEYDRPRYFSIDDVKVLERSR